MKLAKNSEFIQTILVLDASLPISRPNEKLSQLLSLARQENHVTAWGKLVNKHKKAILVPDASLPISRPTEKLSHSCSSSCQLGVNYATTTNTNIEIPPEEIQEKTAEKYQIPESEKYRVRVRGQFCSGGST